MAAVVLVLLPAVCEATVHSGGVASCNVCHSMHDAGTPGGGGSNGTALLHMSPSDICLSCHATSYGAVLGDHVLAPPPERGPGNFVFLLADNLNDGPDGASNPIPGDAAGHNIHARMHGLSTDGTKMTSPGGTYPANKLKCTSCHDPHGNSSYRFLRGPGNQQGSGGQFAYGAPEAIGLDVEVGGVESDLNHVAYLGGMSLWCGNCHLDYLDDHNDAGGSFEHPTDGSFDADIFLQYNLYNGTADPTGGLATTSYLASVPFEDASNTTSRTAGPSGTSQIMCLTCHRAHASSGPYAGRWDFNVTTLGQDGVVSGSYPLPNPYGDANQQPLCFKCHETGED